MCRQPSLTPTLVKTEKQKIIYRYPPRALVPYLLREWLIYRPAQMYIARALGLGCADESLKYEVFPGAQGTLDSDDLSNALQTSTLKHVGYKIGLMNWREIQAHFSRRFLSSSPSEPDSDEDDHWEQRGHSVTTGYARYARSADRPIGADDLKMLKHMGVSVRWQELCCKRIPPNPLQSTR